MPERAPVSAWGVGATPTVAGNALRHQRIITPSISGPNQGLRARIGDFTWDAAHRLCGQNPYQAHTPEGQPAYFTFCYFRLRSSEQGDVFGLALGDVVDVTTNVFQVGPGALYSVHRLAPAGRADADAIDLTCVAEGAVLAETYNRWVSRGDGDSNERLTKATPAGFAVAHLPTLEAAHHPRQPMRRAQQLGSFFDAAALGFAPVPSGAGALRYEVDLARDINGVNLLYFASYFGIVDRALLAALAGVGSDQTAYLGRRVSDQQLAYYGNVDHDTPLEVRYQLWQRDLRWMFDSSIVRATDGALVAVSTLCFALPA